MIRRADISPHLLHSRGAGCRACQDSDGPELHACAQRETSDAANLQASESELGSEDERELSPGQAAARKEAQQGKNRRTIRRPERAT